MYLAVEYQYTSLYSLSSLRARLGVEVLLLERFNLESTGTRTKQSVIMRSIDRISSPSFGLRDPETERREAWISGSNLQPDFLLEEREPELRVGRDIFSAQSFFSTYYNIAPRQSINLKFVQKLSVKV